MTDQEPTEIVPAPVEKNVASTSTSEEFENTFRDIETFMKSFKSAVTKLRQLKREIVSIEKALTKHEERRQRRKMAAFDEHGNKRKNGFSLENNIISDELADFIGYEHGKPISRSEVTRRLTAYVKEHKLQDDKDKRFVNLDTDAGKKLEKLLSTIVDKEGNPTRLTIITMNKFVNKHYIGKVEPPKDDEVSTTSDDSDPKEVSEEKMAASKSIPIKKKILKKKAIQA